VRGWSETRIVDCADAAALNVGGTCPDGGTAWVGTDLDDPEFEPAPFTPAEVAALPVELLVVDTDGTPASTDPSRTAVMTGAPGAAPWLGGGAGRARGRERSGTGRDGTPASTATSPSTKSPVSPGNSRRPFLTAAGPAQGFKMLQWPNAQATISGNS
jgi:hypothetical protein